MAERPILMNAPMVRATLAGTKTQTRRICKSQPYANGFAWDGNDFQCHNDYLPPSAMLMDCRRGRFDYTTSDHEGWASECPYGQPGDRLWVREDWARTIVGTGTEMVVYREGDNRTDYGGPWKPSIHMPRWASRITLEITSVRVERLQDISEADAVAEGVAPQPTCRPDDDTAAFSRIGRVHSDSFPIARYAALWEHLNGPESWATNPWVWVVEFKRLEGGAS